MARSTFASIQRLRRKLWKLLAGNYVMASAGCVGREAFCPTDFNPNDLRDEAEAFSSAGIEPRYRPWFDDATEFQRSYLDELLKLAAVFPRFNSEVEALNDNEFAGWGLPDRHFLLSFDDGPTRGPGHPEPNAEDTDRTIEMVRDNRVNAIFFVMGKTFQARLQETSAGAMKALYSGLCVGDHGWVHKSHALWPQWQELDRVHREPHQGDAAGILCSGVSSALWPASDRQRAIFSAARIEDGALEYRIARLG